MVPGLTPVDIGHLNHGILSLGEAVPVPVMTYSHKDIHIPKSEPQGRNFIDPINKDCVFWLLSSWTDAESTVPYRECSPFLVIRS